MRPDITFCARCIAEADEETRALLNPAVPAAMRRGRSFVNMLAVTFVNNMALCVRHALAELPPAPE
jgi:hypothetical protein